MVFSEWAAKRAIDAVWKKLWDLATRQSVTLSMQPSDLETALNAHLQFVRSWANDISFRDLSKSRTVEATYVDATLFLTPSEAQTEHPVSRKVIRFSHLMPVLQSNTLLTGHTGAGKTTSAKRLALSLLLRDGLAPENFDMPIVLRLFELRHGEGASLGDLLANVFRLTLEGGDTTPQELITEVRKSLVAELLDSLSALLILDGFDEIDPAIQDNVAQEIEVLGHTLDVARIFLTSRTGTMPPVLPQATQYEISPFSEQQVEDFCSRFFLNKKDETNFLAALRTSPYADTTIRPLSLAHLCAIYERTGTVPDKPKTAYRKILNLLLEEWDAQKRVKRPSRYAKFDTDRKHEFLSRLAFAITLRGRRREFTTADLYEVYLTSLHEAFDLPARDAEKVVAELQTHTGIVTKVGPEHFAFAHKSLQEFLAAEYILGLPTVPTDYELLRTIPDELAIATALSSDSDSYFASVIFDGLLRRAKSDDLRRPLEDDGKVMMTRRVSEMVKFLPPFLVRLSAERVDFASSPELAIAVLAIYTVIDPVQSSLKKSEAALAALDDFASTAPIRRAVSRLLLDYEPVSLARGGTVLRLTGDIIGPPTLVYPDIFKV